jgi:ATP-dependent RNA helicase DeaD
VSALIVPHNWRKRVERMFREVNINATWAKPPSVDDVMSRDDERLLADSTLNSPIEDNEKSIVEKLLAQQSPEQIATAFVRQYRAGQSAPEDLLDTGPTEERPKRHEAFRESVWFSLTIGRSQNVEARWILPMLCRVGGITKNEIGKINIEQDETLVELTAASVDGFLKTVGSEMVVEDTIKITRVDNPPRSARPARSERPARPPREDRFNRSDRNARADRPGRKKTYKTQSSPSAPTEDAPAAAEKFSEVRPKPKPKTKSKPEIQGKPEKKLKAKKRKKLKLKLAKAETKSISPGREAPAPGSTPMMRRKD